MVDDVVMGSVLRKSTGGARCSDVGVPCTM